MTKRQVIDAYWKDRFAIEKREAEKLAEEVAKAVAPRDHRIKYLEAVLTEARAWIPDRYGSPARRGAKLSTCSEVFEMIDAALEKPKS